MNNREPGSDNEGIIIGRNAVVEALRAGVCIDKVFISKGEVDAALRHIASAAREAGAAVVEADRHKLDALCKESAAQGGNTRPGDYAHQGEYVHQGVVAMAAYTQYSTIHDMIEDARRKAEQPLIVICDEISDPHNLGAIIRTCEAAGAHGVIIPKRRSAGLSAAVAKASSGALFHVKIARVPNITAAIRELKKSGLWIFAAVADRGTSLWDCDFTGATAIVIGSEGKGVSRLVSDNCDFKASIPMNGKLSSLNASVSASILLFEACRQRR